MTAPDPMLEEAVRHLTSFPRPSASDGERVAAEWIAQRLGEEGADARVEPEEAHGTYWWPLGLLTLIGGLAGLTGRRSLGLLAGGAAAAGIYDDISGGKLWFRRLFLPKRTTYNVVAEAGDPDAARTVVFVSHHDAAHWSLLFHPGVAPAIAKRFPKQYEKADTTAPVMFPVFGGPLLVALGSLLGWAGLRKAGTFLSLGSAATFAEIGSRSTVDGANDNLTGVAAILGIAKALRERPVDGLRVLLVSTGSEESFMEGMQAFARRHFPSLPPETTSFVCLDTVGSPELIQCEGEGMIVMADYDARLKELIDEAAADAGVPLRRNLWFRNATDALIALKAGYPTAMIGSVNEYKLPANYHWPTDTADNVEYATVAECVSLCEAAIRRLAAV
jgi:hypothetical protein